MTRDEFNNDRWVVRLLRRKIRNPDDLIYRLVSVGVPVRRDVINLARHFGADHVINLHQMSTVLCRSIRETK